jgi:hypothetical protein
MVTGVCRFSALCVDAENDTEELSEIRVVHVS